MSDDPDIRRAHGRAAKQERSERTRRAIVEAVVAVLAEQGVAGLTHRLVAQRSGASLAATTYYFTGKADMIAAASDELIGGYFGEFEQIAGSVTHGDPAVYRAFLGELAGRAMTDYRTSTLAWSEIMLDGARDPEARRLARLWFARMEEIWRHAARAFDLPAPERAARSSMDIVLGALLHGLALGFSPDQMAASLRGELDLAALLPAPAAEPEAAAAAPASAKAVATRERILEAAMQLLASRGASAVNYRSVALAAGLTPGAPAYHFASSEELLGEARALLFARSKARYREVIASIGEGLDLATLDELAAVIFQSEATEFGLQNIATYAIWLQAGREPHLRDVVREVIGDLYGAWSDILVTAGAVGRGPAPLLVQYLFVGALIRVIVCGVTAMDLVEARIQLKGELTALAGGAHWLQARGGDRPPNS